MAATFADGVVQVWDVETGKSGPQFPLGVPGGGNVAFSPDEHRLSADIAKRNNLAWQPHFRLMSIPALGPALISTVIPA